MVVVDDKYAVGNAFVVVVVVVDNTFVGVIVVVGKKFVVGDMFVVVVVVGDGSKFVVDGVVVVDDTFVVVVHW